MYQLKLIKSGFGLSRFALYNPTNAIFCFEA